MSQQEKAAYYRAVKAAGVEISKPYRNCTTAELKQAYDTLVEAGVEVDPIAVAAPAPRPQPAPAAPQDEPEFDAEALRAAYDAAVGAPRPEPARAEQQTVTPVQAALNREADQLRQDVAGMAAQQAGFQKPTPPRAAANPNEMPSQRLNTQDTDEPIRVDENGLVWYQEEVRKPAFPKPRGRRVLKYMESGVETQTLVTGKTAGGGDIVETFEVAGEAQLRPAEVKITLPSYQVGIYKDPRFPFKIHVYNENRGFDLFEVQAYYGGSELVPAEIKRVYVENVLCYDIRTTVRAIQNEYRQLQLQNRV